jgi:DNA-binding transcriptional LysR family regulator
MRLSALADFHLVATAGSLGRASRESGQSKATLSRHIRQLEESLGVRLVERGQRALRLTREGRSMYEETYMPLRDIEDIGRRLAYGQEQLRGLLRVSAPVLFSEAVGARLSAEYTQSFPGVHLEWIVSDSQLDLVDEGIDVVIRVNPKSDSQLVGRCFAHDTMLVVAPPSLPVPKDADSVVPGSVPAVAMSKSPDIDAWQVKIDGHCVHVAPDYRLRLPSFGMVRAAVCAGAGAALLPRSLVRADIAAGRLSVWGVYTERTVEAWVLHNSRRLVSRKVSAFVDFIVESFPTKEL